MRTNLFIAGALVLAGCGSSDPNAEQSRVENRAAATAARSAVASAPASASKPKLDGEWTVTELQGEPASGMTVAFQDGTATAAAGCVKRSWTYSQNGGAVSLKASPQGSSNCGGGTSVAQESLFSAVGDANMAIFDDDGRKVSLSGYGGSVGLTRR